MWKHLWHDQLRSLVCFLALLLFGSSAGSAKADVITPLYFNFKDATRWDVVVDSTNGSIDVGASGPTISGNGLFLEFLSGSGAVTITATLGGPKDGISTAGYKDIQLEFFQSNLTTGGLEITPDVQFFDASGGDGYEILTFSSLDVDFDTGDAGTSSPFRTTLFGGDSSGTPWVAANAAFVGQSLSFSNALADGELDDLVITMQIDNPGETLTLSNFRLVGTPVSAAAAVPEPSALLFLAALF
ncbi:MAG: hypothetical protein KDA85_18075, partial [Planctomycetaceae bacterium]|nr:hypothetical protein [Planctomycetaceae bacterium]